MTHTHRIVFNRKRAALTQEELAYLLSISQSAISRLEETGEACKLDLEIVLGLQVVFGLSPRAMFSELYTQVEDAVMTRAATLDLSLRDKVDPDSMKKKQLFSSMVKRATANLDEL